jgi:NAD(P)-dependent dehydrogenase (short-subunit alcohol dehydrogenase family)
MMIFRTSKVRPPFLSFDNRTAIVTGAGRGLGRLYAQALADRGANVLVNDTGAGLDGRVGDSSVAEAAAAEIRDRGGNAAACIDSVADMNGGRRIVEAAMDAFKRVDILINNAGILCDRSLLKMTEAEWDDVIAVHLKGAFSVTQPALFHMKSANFGRIVFSSSASGLFGNFGQANYGAAKMGVIGLMNCLKEETAKYNIKINSVAPAGVTRMTENLFSDEMKSAMDPSFNVPLILFLASEQNTNTGMIFCAKGGWYSRVAVVCAPGAVFDRNAEVSAEDIRDRFEEIASLQNAIPLECGADTMRFVE